MHPKRDSFTSAGSGASKSWLVSLTGFALMLAISLVLARATIQENLRDRQVIVPGSVAVPRAAGPAMSLTLDLLLCVPALLVLWRRVLDRDFRLRGSLAHALFAGIAVLAAASAFWSSDKFAAVVTSSHLVAAAALMWAMTQLIRTWAHTRLVAGACFAILLVFVAQGVMSRFIDLPDNIKYWQDHQSEILSQRGLEPGSFAAEQFERKLRSGELFGFNASPNTFAALLVLLGVVGVGALIQRFADKDEHGWPVAILTGLLLSLFILYYTFSRTALVTPFFAAGLLYAIPRIQSAWRKKLYAAGVASFILGCIALIGHGLYHGTLVQESLTFRWRYWVGAAGIFARHPWHGTGWSNFASYYLGARLPIATEEIKDPHNLIVRAFVELGVVGGVLMLGWLARIMWELSAPGFRLSAEPSRSESRNTNAANVILGLCGAGIILNIVASVDFMLQGSDTGWFIVMELFKRGLFLVLLLLGLAAVTLRSTQEPVLDDRPAPWIGFAMIAGIAVFLVHNLIDFSLFEPGPMFVFAMLLGATIGMRGADAESKQLRWTTPAAIAATLCWITAAATVAAPIAIAEVSVQQANEDLRNNRVAIAAATLRNTFSSLWISNSDYASQAAMALEQSGASADQVRAMLDAAIQAEPMRAESARAVAEYELRLQGSASAQRLTWGFERAVSLDPNSVALHKRFADVLADLGEKDRAAREYEAALRYDDLLPAREPKRLTAAQVDQIRQKLASLKP